MDSENWYVYVLQSIDGLHQYVGMSADPESRLKEHNAGQSRFTKTFRPWKIVYIETAGTREEAREREKYYKSAAGRRKIKKILENHFGV
jgi:putative endonuclease